MSVSDMVGPSCEPLFDAGWLPGLPGWVQPGSAWSSLSYVVAGVWIIVAARRRPAGQARTLAVLLGVLAIGNGIGSVAQHGPAPKWNPLLHDPPLAGALALVAADGLADLLACRFRHWWWMVPTTVVVALAATAPEASAAFQAVLAVVAVGVTGWRLVRWRRILCAPSGRIWLALALLAVCGAIGTLSRPGMPLCDPTSTWFRLGISGHFVWHLLSAAALVVLAPALGTRHAALASRSRATMSSAV